MKQWITTFSLLFLALSLFAQPANDDCDGLIDLGVAPYCPDVTIPGNETEIYDNVGATPSDIGFGNNPICFNGGVIQHDVWFAFTTSDTIFDYTITLMGVEGPDGTSSIVNPQMALYRGDCEFDGLAELLCASAEPGETMLELDAEGLTPNVTYFIRVDDYSETGTPNSGAFTLCIDEQEPINLIDEGSSTSCSGELYDSGGPDGDYQNNEDFVYTICPNTPNQCITFTLEYYNIEYTEFGVADQLLFYDGDEVNPGSLIASIGGTDFATEVSNGGGVCFQVQASSGCLTVQFISDGQSTFEGFAGAWECSSTPCDPPTPITVDDQVTDLDIVDFLATPQTQLTITDINCDEGSYGTFEAGDDSDLGLGRGLLLTTGDLFYAVGPNSGEGGGNPNAIRGFPGDEDLDILSDLFGNGQLSQDACVLELDVIAATDELTFEYVFGSDEYTEFVNSNFNDIFAFLISGPGITGIPEIDNQENIAVLPDGSNTFVEINSVNNEQNWEYFRSNELGQSVEYDGLTSDFLGVKKSLTARAEVIPCSTYHLKLAIADRGDGSWDSGVFISEIRGGTPDLTINFSSGIDYLIEDCTDEPDELIVRLNSPVDDVTSYNITVEGTATQNEDYILDLPDVIVFQPGETEFSFPITVLSDLDNNEGIETIRISLNNDFGCGDVTYTTLEVELHDQLNVEINLGQDTAFLCVGGSVNLQAEGAAQYFWNPVPIFDNPSSNAPLVTPTESGWVQVEGNILDCTDVDSIYLQIIDPMVEIETEDPLAICVGDTIQLTAFNNVGNQGISWTPEFSVSDPNIATPEFFPEVPTDYVASISIAGCTVSDTISVDVDFLNIPAITGDTAICQNFPVPLAVLENPDTTTSTYAWSPMEGLEDTTIPDPIAIPDVTTTYQLITTVDNMACADTSSFTVTVIPADVEIQNSIDTVQICLGETVDLNAFTSTGNAENFTWSPDDGSLSTTDELNVIASPDVTTQYFATLTIGACTVIDSIVVQVDSLPTDLSLIVDPLEDSYCEGELVTITSPIYDPANFQNIEHEWIGLGIESGDSLYNLVLTTVDTFTYQRITTSGACQDIQEVTLNVITSESLTITPAEPVICAGESVQLEVTAGMLGEITWTPSADLSCADCPTPVAMPSSTTTYTVESVIEDCPTQNSVTVVVDNVPAVSLLGDQEACQVDGASFILNEAAAEAGATYTWTSSSDPGFSSDEAAPEVIPTTTTTYSLTATNQCGETTGDVTISIIEPAVLSPGEGITTCVGTEFSLNATAVGGGGAAENFTWIYDGESELGPNSDFVATTSGVAVINYTYGPQPDGCETLVDSVFIEVLDIAFTVDIESEPVDLSSIYQGSEFILEAVVDPPAGFDYSYSWTGPGDIASPNDAITDVTAPLDQTGDVNYEVVVSIPEGCEESAVITVEVQEPAYEIPNIFSPNGDGTNDIFKVFAGGGVEDFECWVYNRWGQLIFESDNVDDAWDGTYNGVDAPSEVYYYLIRFRVGGQDIEEKGDVTLVR